MIIDHDNPACRARWKFAGAGRYNGAFFYSKEIVENIIPRVKTDRNWITVNQPGEGIDHSIVFVHNNKNPEHYDWLAKYKDLILVCGVPETCQKVAHLGKTVYLPLSVDVAYVERFRRPKIADTAYVGRLNKMQGTKLPRQVLCLSGLTRTRLLTAMAQYKRVYAVGRCAIEAKVLGCEVLPFDPRFPDPSIWKVLDNKDAAKILQKELDKIDGGKR